MIFIHTFRELGEEVVEKLSDLYFSPGERRVRQSQYQQKVMLDIINKFDEAVDRLKKTDYDSTLLFYGVMKTKADILMEL
jgi:hypothetical protein